MLLLFNIRIVVATIGGTVVNNHTNQLKVVVLSGVFQFELCTLCSLVKVFLSVLAHVEIGRELKIVIHFLSLHGVKIELKTLECHDQISWQSFDACSLKSVHFLITLCTEVLIAFI